MAKLEIEIKAAVDDAVKELKKVNEALDDTKDSGRTAGLSMLDLNAGMELVEKAAKYVQQAYDATVKVFLDYAAVVRDVTSATGVSADEASRLIEASDDMGVSVGTLKLAMRTMLQDGLQPTVENFAKLADEYNAIEDPAKRAQFAMEKFGRAGIEMTKWLENGSAAMLESSGIMDDEMAQTAEDARLSLDALGDASRNVALAAGATLAPALIKVANALADAITYNDRLIKSLNATADATKMSGVEYAEYVKTLEDAAEKAGYFVDEQGNLAQSAGGFGRIIIQTNYMVTESERKLAETIAEVAAEEQAGFQATKDLAEAQRLLGQEMYNPTEGFKEQQRQIDADVDRMREAEAATKALNDAQAAMAAGLAGAVGKELENFNQRQADVAQSNKDIQAEIDKLNAKWWLSPAQKQQLEDLKTKLEENNEAIKANADEHDLATKRILFGYLQQQLARDTLTIKEITDLNAIAVKWGLMNQASADAYNGVIAAADAYASSGNRHALENDLANVEANAHKAQWAINNITDKLVTITTRFITEGGAPPVRGDVEEWRNGRAAGGPVSAGQPYLVGERGPEMFVPQQSGQIVPNQNIYNLTVNTVNPPFIPAEFGHAQAMAGAM